MQRTYRPVASLLITGSGRFLQILDLCQGLKIGVPSGCLGENLDFIARPYESRVSILTRDIDIANLSVRPSVCPSVRLSGTR